MGRTLPPVHDAGPGMSDAEGARPPALQAIPMPELEPFRGTHRWGRLAAPDLLGMTTHDARQASRSADLQVSITTRTSEEALWGRIVAQDPEPGGVVRPGDDIELTVGARPEVVVPDVRGGVVDEMLDVLREAGLRPQRRVARRSGSLPEGHILRTRPRAGATVPHGTGITYVVATERQPRRNQHRRDSKRARFSRLPDGSFLSLPVDD